jgi:hypothetical protein
MGEKNECRAEEFAGWLCFYIQHARTCRAVAVKGHRREGARGCDDLRDDLSDAAVPMGLRLVLLRRARGHRPDFCPQPSISDRRGQHPQLPPAIN